MHKKFFIAICFLLLTVRSYAQQPSILNWPNGKLKSFGYVVDGQFQGKWIFAYQNGNLFSHGFYKSGQPDSLLTEKQREHGSTGMKKEYLSSQVNTKMAYGMANGLNGRITGKKLLSGNMRAIKRLGNGYIKTLTEHRAELSTIIMKENF